jgi:two-component system CheB/CheR fusion protein
MAKTRPSPQARKPRAIDRPRARIKGLERPADDMQTLLNNIEIAVIFLDTNLCLRLFTPAVKDFMEVMPSDLGRPLAKLARKFDDESLLADARTVMSSATRLEKEITSQSGRVYMRRILPGRSADDRITGVVITFIDISERERAEAALRESENRYRLIFEGLKDYAIFMLDDDGRIATWNSGAERVLKYTKEEAVGKPFEMIFTDEDKKAGKPAAELAQARQQRSLTQEGWRVRKDGEDFWGVGILTRLLNEKNQPCGFVKILRDATEHKLSEEALKHATQVAEAANAAKDNFLANISHELRTPLGAITLWINLLEEEETLDPLRVRETLAAIKKCAEEQGKLIEDLLDTSRIVAGKFRLEFKECDLVSVVRAGVEAIRPGAIEKGVQIEEALDSNVGFVNADPNRIQQVIWNLLNNAVKFTPAEGNVRIAMRRQGKNVEIRVTDSGQGISKEFLPYVFDRFGQAEMRPGAGYNNGLGLGLSIAKQIVEMHGGTIGADSAGADQGSTFTVWLPLPQVAFSPSSIVEDPGSPASSTALAGRHVLLIEDMKQTRKALETVLKKARAEVIAVDSGKAALEAFGQRKPDLIVSDIGLPDIDGYELIQQIRNLEKSLNIPSVPALALTAFAGKNVYRKALESGFHVCLIKPIQAKALVSALVSLQETASQS